MSIRKATFSGIAWIGGFRGLTRVVSLGKTILLARLLSPSQFGIFGVAALTMSLLEVFTETGINTVLIQLKESAKDYINSAYIVSIIRGVAISIIMIVSSSLVASFFNIPESRNLILLASAIPFVRGFINPSEVNFQKELLFKKEFYFRTSIFLVDAVVSILLAIITRNPISLVWGILSGAIFEMVLSHLIFSRPILNFDTKYIKHVLKRGKWMTASGIMDYLIQNGDNIVVGRLLGSASLGFYQMSYQVSTAPITEISNILSKVTFPIFMKISDEEHRLKSAYLKVASSVLIVAGICTLILVLFSNQLVSIVLGEKWLVIIPTIKILSIFALIKSLVLSSYAFLLAKQKQEVVTLISLIGFISMFVVIYPLVLKFGIIGAAYSALFGAVISLIPTIYYLNSK